MRPCTSAFAPGACACSERAARPKRGWDLSGQREDRVGRRRITHEQAHVARGIAALVQGMRDPEALLPTHPEPSVSALIAHQPGPGGLWVRGQADYWVTHCLNTRSEEHT